VLGPPDNQAIGDQADAYKALVDAAVALPIAAAPNEDRHGYSRSTADGAGVT